MNEKFQKFTIENKNRQIHSAEEGDRDDPKEIRSNQLYNLPYDQNPEYMYYLGNLSFLIEFQINDCVKSIDYRMFETNDYDRYDEFGYFSRLMTRYTKNRYLVTSSEIKLYFLRTINRELSCSSSTSGGKLIMYQPKEELKMGKIYSKNIDSQLKSSYHLNLIKDQRYKINFTQEEGYFLEFEIIYSEADTITNNFYKTIYLYNNSEFTAQISANAIVLVRSYNVGNYTFNFEINKVENKNDNPKIAGFNLHILFITSIIFVTYLLINKKSNRY